MPSYARVLVSVAVLALWAGDAVAGERYAFLVGVKKYKSGDFSSLLFTENDISQLAKVLRKAGIKSENIVVMTLSEGANDPTRLPQADDIRRALDRMLARADDDDSLIVAFSGHGVQFDGEDHAYFCPMDADLRKRETLISLKEVYKALEKNCRAGTKLLLVDACRKNEAPPPPTPKGGDAISPEVADLLQKMAPPLGIAALFSCSSGELSWEDAQLGHGVFFHFVIEALSGKADSNGDREVSLAELEQYAGKGLVDYYVSGRISKRQTPKRAGGESFGAAALVQVPDPFLGFETGETRTDNAAGMTLVWCEPGEFAMQGPWYWDPDEPVWASVTLTRGFWIGRTEVTQAQWTAVMDETPWKGHSKPDDEDGSGVTEGPNYPAVVSWNDATEFCRKLTANDFKNGRLGPGWEYRLPTCAQWEYACRAGDETEYSQEDVSTLREYGWFGLPEEGTTERLVHEAASKKANKWGLFDMHGNVLEHCRDVMNWARPGASDPFRGPSPEQKDIYMAVGGKDWDVAYNGDSLLGNSPSHWSSSVGFRVVLVRPDR